MRHYVSIVDMGEILYVRLGADAAGTYPGRFKKLRSSDEQTSFKFCKIVDVMKRRSCITTNLEQNDKVR